MSNNLTDEELISKGKEMVRNGLGNVFVVKWVRDRVPDADRRAEIMKQITGSKGMVTEDNEQRKKDREQRKVKYLYEDFLSGKNQLKVASGISFMTFAFLLVSSLGLKAASYPHCFFALLLGIGFLMAFQYINWQKKSMIVMVFGIYIASAILMLVIFQLPDRFVPGFGEFEQVTQSVYNRPPAVQKVKVVNFLTVLNDLSPFAYLGILLALITPFVKMLKYMNGLLEIPRGVREEMGIKVEN